MDSLSPKPRRIRCIDQGRALAIFAMIFVHFGEGAITRLGLSAMVQDLVLAVGRIATPGFVCIFGLAVGLAYMSKFDATQRAKITRRLVSRGFWLMPCVLMVRFDKTLNLIEAGVFDPVMWVWRTYSILTFYVLAIVTMPLFLRLLYGRGLAWPIGIGISMWGFGTAMVWQIWPDSEIAWQRVLRLLLVSGPYPYFQLMGTAVLMMPLGAAIKRHHQADTLGRAMTKIGLSAAGVCAASLAWAVWREPNVSLAGFADGSFKVPTRPWYFGFYCGAMLVITVGLYWMNVLLPHARTLTILTLLGQAALTVYVGQALILPALASMDILVEIIGLLRVAMPLAILLLICGLVVLRQHQLSIRSRPAWSLSKAAILDWWPRVQSRCFTDPRGGVHYDK